MTLDDRDLRDHLERRAQAGIPDVSALTEAVMDGSSRLGQTPATRRIDSRFLGIGVAAAVAVAVLGAVVLLPTRVWPSPGASADASPGVSLEASPRTTAADLTGFPSEQALTTEELFSALFDARGLQPGTLVIADVAMSSLRVRCSSIATPCASVGIRSASGEHVILVYGTPASMEHSPYAFRVRTEASLDFVGSVSPGPKKFAWTLSQVADALDANDELEAARAFVLVDGWLGSLNGSPFCPLAVPGPSGVLDAFSCGQAAWVLPDGNVIGPIQLGSPPAVGLRLPNEIGAIGSPHGFWLIKPIGMPSGCFLCPPSGAATLIGRVDPIDTPTQPERSASTKGMYPVDRALSAAELAAFIDDPWFARAAPIVIADVALAPPVPCLGDYSCPRYSITVPGRPNPILVWDDRAGGPTPPAPVGPIAYRVKTDVPGLDLIGPVRPNGDGLAWTLPRLAPLLPRIRTTESSGHPFFLVEGWIKTTRDTRSCVVIPSPRPTQPDFTLPCGQGLAWLIPEESIQHSGGPQPTWLRVPYLALPETLGAEPLHGYWLIDPWVSADGCSGCTSAGPADVLGSVLSLSELRTSPTPGG